MEENTGVFSISFLCPDGRSLRGSIGTLSGLSPIQEPTVLKDLPGRVRAVLVYCDCSILFLALGCLVPFSTACGETGLFRALTGCSLNFRLSPKTALIDSLFDGTES